VTTTKADGSINSLGIAISHSEVNKRANLMAEIRETGGFGGAKLKPPSERKLAAPNFQSGPATKGKKKLGGPPKGCQMDLVADLKNFLRVKKK